MSDCIKRITERSNGAFNAEQAREIIEDVTAAAERRALTTGDKESAVENILDDRIKNVESYIQKQKENTLRNIKIRDREVQKIDRRIQEEGLSPRAALQALLVGVQRKTAGGRNSIDAQQVAIKSQIFSKLLKPMMENNLLDLWNSNILRKEIAIELEQLAKKKDGKVGKTGSKQAAQIAKIIHDVQVHVRDQLNAYGADIGELDGFVMTQTHNPVKMRRMGVEQWKQTVRPLLDMQRTFGDTDPEEALDEIYKDLVSGRRLEDNVLAADSDAKLFQFTGPANLGKRLSQSRSLHFKDAESFIAYNDEIGMRDFNEGIISSIEFGAKNIALMKTLGTNPQAMLNNLLDHVNTRYRMDESTGRKLDKVTNNFYKEVSGETMMAVDPTVANVSSMIRTLQAMSKLGGAVLSATADVPLVALELQYQGKNFLSSYALAFKNVSGVFDSKADRIKFGSLTGVGMDGIISSVGARWTGNDTPVGAMSKLQRKFFQLNGLSGWTDSNKRGLGKIMSHSLALEKNLSWDELTQQRKDLFAFYDIGESDWNHIRKAARKEEGDDREFIFAEEIEDSEVSLKLQTYYSDRVDHGVITGGARERAIWSLGTQRGTPEGEALRFVSQFKQFPTTVITRVWGRALMNKGRADMPMFAQTLIMSGIFGYIAGAAKDIAKGNEPKDPLMKETIMASFLQGGGAGLLGDFLFADANRYGGGILGTIAGPSVGTLEDAWQVINSLYYKQDANQAASQAVRLIQSNFPFLNLFYVKPALDNLVMHHIHEELNPGYLRRMERRLKKDFNQDKLF